MSSNSARVIDDARQARTAATTVDARMALLERLKEEGLASYMALHGVDRRTAVERIEATRRLGRPRSTCG